nr:hypothetical protein [Tanacetum cinerariifolium]
MGEGSANPTNPHHTFAIIPPSTSQHQKKQKPKKTKRKDIELPQTSGPTTNIADEAVNEEINDDLERAATTASSLEASERVSKLSNDSLFAGINTPRSDENSLKLKELMELCTTLQNMVLDLENTKTTQAMEIDSLKRRVESSDDNEDLGEDTSKLGRISDIDADEGITLVSTHDDAKMFDADNDLHGEEAEKQQQLTDAKKATLFMQFLEKKRKFFAAKVAEEKRNKPPTQA